MIHQPLSPEFAATDPEAYKYGLILHLGNRAVYGQQMWNAGLETGVDPARITINPATYKSAMTPRGDMILGAGNMPADHIAKREFLGPHETERTQTDWAAWRLLHEAMHLRVDHLRSEPGVGGLLSVAKHFRRQGQGQHGLTPLASSRQYADRTPAEKAEEDVVDLVTMAGWGGEPIVRSYAEMVGGSRRHHKKQRDRYGLVHADGPRLYGAVGAAVREVLSRKAR
jgi:hypothetical protein